MLRAEVEITFKKIAGKEVEPRMVGFALKHATNKTMRTLCQELKKYFKEKHIETEIVFELITKEEEIKDA